MKKLVFNQSLKSAALGVGSIVQYEKALTSGEEKARFVIVENYGDGRVKVRELTSVTAFGFSTYTRFLSDFVAVTDPAEIETLCDIIKNNETPLYLVVLENLENERKAAATLDEAEEITAPTADEIREAFESREYICDGWNGGRARYALETFEAESAKAKEQKERAKTARRAEILKRFAKESEKKAAEALHTFAEIVINHFTPTTAKFKAFADGLRIWLESAPATLDEAEEITETNAPATETRATSYGAKYEISFYQKATPFGDFETLTRYPENIHNYYYFGEYGREIYVTIADAEIFNDGEFGHACDEYGHTLYNNISGDIVAAPADAPTYPHYKAPARVLAMAKDFAEDGGKVEKVTRRGVELVAIHRPTGSQILLLSPEQFATIKPAPATLDEAEEITAAPLDESAKSEENAKPEKPAKAAGVVAAAFFLLSLTIGTSHEAAEIVTNDPAAVFAQVAEAGETLTAFALEEIPTAEELPATDVPALL